MWKLVALIIIALPVTGFSKDKDIKGLFGHWMEVKRLDKSGKAVSYRDTLYLELKSDQTYVWQKKNGYIYKEKFDIENGHLDLGMRYYTILNYKDGKKMVLQDDQGTYELHAYIPAPDEPNIPKPKEKMEPVKNIYQLVGEWEKYKGDSRKTVETIDYTRLVKKIVVFSSPEKGKLGYVYGSKDSGEPSWYIETITDGVIYCNGKDERALKVTHVKDDEMVVEDEIYTYYLKK